MGALPSRESNEDPSSVFFANCGSHVVFHVPMTSHYFPSPNSLAFRQLYHARNHQSALYCFDMKDVSPVMPADVAAAFHEAQEEDWGEEVDEMDPSLHYYDEEIREKLREFGRNADATSKDASTGTSAPRSPRVGRHLRPSIADREELYRVLVTEPMEGTLVDTDAEMCALFEQEQRWRAALPHLFNRQKQQGCNSSRRCKINHGHGFDEKDPGHAPPGSGASATNQQSHNEGVKRGRGAAAANGIGDAKAETPSLPVAEPLVSSVSPPPPPPPGKFLYPLPRAIALRLTTEEEEEMRAEYCRQHGIPYVAPAFRSVGAASGNDTAAGVDGSAAAAPHVAPPAPLPVVERRHYHFEDDPLYRDGRVHLVEEHGVLYHFCYFAKQPSQTGTAVAVAAASSSRGSQEGETTEGAAATGVMAAGTTPISPTPIVRGRCLHDVVYCEEPSASLVSSSKNVVASSSESPGSELEVVAPVRYSRCARCGERVTQRMDYTQLRRLKSTRAHRRAVRERLRDGGQDLPETKNRMDEVSPHTERVEEEGEEEFIINIMPVRVVGMDGLLPSRCRGTPWLRGYGQEWEAAEDAYIEQLGQKPPVMRVCRFIEGSVGDKIVNRAALLTLLSYRPMCQQAGLRDVLMRPIWSMCALSNIPYLQMVRETFFRAKAAVAEVDDDDLLLRRWLDVVDRDNNFYNFINANLHMTRNCTPPERTVRQREQTDDTASAGTASSRRTIKGGGGGVREGGSVGTNLADSSSLVSPLLPKTAVYPAVGDASRPSESLAVHPDTSVSEAVALPSPQGASPNPCPAAGSPPPTTSSATPQLGDDVANSAVAASESAERARQTISATAHCVCGKKNDTDGDWKPAESNGTDLCSRHLTRALEEATIGRPEGHGPRDQVDEEDDDDVDADEEGREEGASDNEMAVDAAIRRGKGNKTQHKVVELSSQCFDDPSLSASSADQCATNSAAGSISPCTEDRKEMRDNGRGVAVATSMMGERPDAVSSPYGAHRHRSGGTKDSDNASGEAGDTSTITTGILPSAASPSTPIRQWRGGDDDAMKLSINNFDDDEDPDLRTEEEEGRPSRASVARTSAMGYFPLERATASSTVAAEAHTTAKQSPTAAKPSQQQRPGVPPRPNFQLFSSRLEPHAPLSLCTLFDCDTRTDQAAKRTVTQLAAAAAVEADVGTGHHSKASSRDDDGAGHVSAAASAAAEAATTVWPSYVQRDILRENERQQAEPKAMRRPSHALYECGMLTTTRGRNFLFLLREDCVQALLYYCSTAAAPIFIGAYIEPVDTTSLSYGGAVRLQRPSTVDIPLDGGGEDEGSCAVPARNYDGHRVVLGQVEGMEVIAEYFKSKGLITCFSVSDVDKAAPGPSAAHRLRKMILPTTSSSTLYSQHYRSSASGVLAEEAGSLAVRQARELAQYSHVFTYAADDFCDGDLVVFNFEERRWEHYEHVQLRRRFAAKAAADAADVVTTAASSMPVNTSAPTSTGNVAAATCGSQNFTNSDMDPSMSARLLCVGLDELLLSWTKWIVDNRFYEDRTDLGWLRLPDGSPIQLGDRYFLWSFRHNHQRYFYGVIPKFAKGRLRRQKMIERNRSKKAAEALRPPAPPQAGLLAVSPVRTRRSTDGRVLRSPPSSPAHVAASAIAPPGLTSSNGIRSRWACEMPEAKPEEEPRLCGDGTDTRSLHVDPALGCPASSPLVHHRLATASSSRAGATQQTPPQKTKLSTSAAPQAVSTAAASSAHSTAMRQCQPHSSPHQVQQPTLQRFSITATASFVSAAPTTAGEQAQQGNLASSLNSAGGLPVRVGTHALRPILCSPKNAAGSLTTTATTATTAAYRSLLLSPSLQHSVNGSGNCPSTHSSILPMGLGGEPNYYYQYGGNTFIQDGKRHENEYYPPLPTSTAFHPVTAITKFVPLPHPKTERGGIPPVFRFWGPIGSPALRTPAAAPLLSHAGGAAPTASWGAIPTLLVPQQAHLLSPRHPTTGSPAAGSAVNGGESMGVGVGQVEAQHHTSGFNLSAGPCAALATAPASAMAAAGASPVNLTVRVRRRTLGGNTARKAAIGVRGGASLAPLPPASPSVSSLGASRTTGTVTGPGTPFRHSPLAPSILPTPSRVTQPAPTQLLANDSELQRLSPTSMLPANLINEGSKTKGESVLRVDEDTYMQREAFRWNPYASTKWAQNRSSSAGGSVSGAGGSHSVEGGSGRC